MDFGTCFVVVLVVIMYVIAWIDDQSHKSKWKERPPKLPNPNNRNFDMQRLADNAVTIAIDKFGITLDFKENSLQQLELLLQQAHEQYKQLTNKSANTPIENTVTTWGSYCGEVIRRSIGGNWILDNKQLFIQLGSRRLDPLGQVRLRITKGPAYNVQSYFQELKPKISKPNYFQGYSSTIDSDSKSIRDYGINEIRSCGKFTPTERAAEYRRRGKSPSGVIDGVYNDAYRGNDEYNDMYRDWDANA